MLPTHIRKSRHPLASSAYVRAPFSLAFTILYLLSALCLPACLSAPCIRCSMSCALSHSVPFALVPSHSLATSSSLLQIQLAVDIPDLPLTSILLSLPAFSCAWSTRSTFHSVRTLTRGHTHTQAMTDTGGRNVSEFSDARTYN